MMIHRGVCHLEEAIKELDPAEYYVVGRVRHPVLPSHPREDRSLLPPTGALVDHCMLSVATVIAGEEYSMGNCKPSEGITVPLPSKASPSGSPSSTPSEDRPAAVR
jgi:hypothetical protein